MAPVIEAEHLTHFYGSTRGIEDLSFSVQPGEVFGFLGPNGAGKTTTIRTILDLIRPTAGSVRVFGLDAHAAAPEIHARVGFLPGDLALYDRMDGRDYLRTFASFRGDGVTWDGVEALAERLRLDLTRRIKTLSHGNRQKVGLMQAFMHEPDLLILDEPTQGLDPLVQQEFYGLLDESRVRGGTTFLSSHVMPEVERVCDRVAIIREGRLVTVSDVGVLKARALRWIELHFDRPVDPGSFASLPSVERAEAHGESLRLTVRGPLDQVIKEAAKHTVVNIETEEASLEEIFLTIYRDGGAPGGSG
ncbi:MAG: ATP-binding cassette domain-containing protein [Actinomycetota bacterium]